MVDTHSALYYSLREVLRHPRCASRMWMQSSTYDLDELRIRNLNVTSRFWSDDGMDPLPIAFPARLNLKGASSHITLDFDVEEQEYV